MADIDLNLLRTFDALMEHRSVTRAAGHLGVTQSAVSHALARLRRTVDDPLFVRGAAELQPTARAEEIAGGIRKALNEVRDALTPSTFDPTTAERHFTIAASSYFCTLLVPALVERLRTLAPGISLRLVPSSELFGQMLDRGAIDLAFGNVIDAPARIIIEPLYRESWVWIASVNNPIVSGKLQLDGIDNQRRIVIAPGRPFGDADALGVGAAPSDYQGRQDEPAPGHNRIVVYDSQTAVALVARTDLVARVPEKVAARAVAQGHVVMLDWLEETEPYQVVMIWHARQRSDQGLVWLRDQIRNVVQDDRWPTS